MPKYYFLLPLLFIGITIWAFNSTRFAPAPENDLRLMSHRGMHQQFDLNDVENDTCTAERMQPPTHGYIENTLPSIKAAIDLGADIVELDIHPTIDDEFAVFHDWSLDCRTDGHGRTRDQTSVYLQSLDIGYGYTADSGQTHPFRGKFIGKMPMLDDVLEAFPKQRFLINIKSRSSLEAGRLNLYLRQNNFSPNQIILYGHETPIAAFSEIQPDAVTFSKQRMKDCLANYVLKGWSGYVPKTCQNTWVTVPENMRFIMWGWPNRFQKRMSDVGSQTTLIGPQTRKRANPAIDTLEQTKSIPKDFGGIVWTNRIEIIGPAVKNGLNKKPASIEAGF